MARFFSFLLFHKSMKKIIYVYMLIYFIAEKCSSITVILFCEVQRKRERQRETFFSYIFYLIFYSFYLGKMFSISHSISWNMEHSQLMFNTSFFFVCVYVCVMHDHVSVGPCVPSGAHLCLCIWTLWFCILSLVSNKDTKAILTELGRQLSSWELRFQRTHVRSSQRLYRSSKGSDTLFWAL